MNKDDFIGVFDSGAGGISLLKEALKILPNENYIYYGDSKNAPYGIKTKDEVENLTIKICEKLIKKNCKAIVIACNTATSAGAKKARTIFNIPILGVEPALKPAVENTENGKIIVLATDMTLKEEKFKNLYNIYKEDREIIKIPAPKFVSMIEQKHLDDVYAKNIIDFYLKKYKDDNISAVVLGCTHFIFLKDILFNYFKSKPLIVDGNLGTVNNLKRILENKDLLNSGIKESKLEIINSSNDDYFDDLYKYLLYL
ncbi:MAG: glutamate racemase [Peptostreptococcaceae bacterium]|nr:glutamate racemase [Peptostreptococcaceae bacterium]